MPPITVVLADDDLIVREGVRALLGYDPHAEVVGVAGDYDKLVAPLLWTSRLSGRRPLPMNGGTRPRARGGLAVPGPC